MKLGNKIVPAVGKVLGGVKAPLLKVTETGIDVPLLKRIMGTLGVALPVILVVWGIFICRWYVQDSISDYYSLRTRDAFVGILFVIGWILFAYKGPEKIDGIAGKLACIFAMGVAIFPNSGAGWERIVHFTSATCLFALLGFFSIFLFTKTQQSKKEFWGAITDFHFHIEKKYPSVSSKKSQRNAVYIWCGAIIWACILLTGLYMLLGQNTVLSSIKPVLILEWIMIWAFGISWFVKGETVLQDK